MYSITDIQDVSRRACKRIVVHVDVDASEKDIIKKDIATVTIHIKDEHKANVVRVYVHYDKKVLCQSLWVEKGLTKTGIPKPLEYNDFIGDIGIVWS